MAANRSSLSGDCTGRISYIQRTILDEQGLRILPDEISAALRTAVDLNSPLDLWHAEIRGISRFWPMGPSPDPNRPYFTKDILAGLNGQRIPLYFLIRGEPKRIRLFIGTLSEQEGAGPTVRTVFNSQYPGVWFWPEKDLAGIEDRDEFQRMKKKWKESNQEFQEKMRSFIYRCDHVGVVTGFPTPNTGENNGAGTQLDRLIRGLYGTEWAFLVWAEPEEDTTLVELQLAALKEQMRIEQEEQIKQWTEQEEMIREKQASMQRTITSYYLDLLQKRYAFLDYCLHEGGWWVQSYICSPDLSTYERAKGLIKSIFSGDFSRVDRIRVLDCPGAGPKAASFSPINALETNPQEDLAPKERKPRKYHTLVSSGQLSALIHLPRMEMPGFYVKESAPFDVSSHVPADKKESEVIEVGEILDRGRPTGNSYRVPIDELTKHCLLVGITGSGKTNTSFHLLKQLQQEYPDRRPIPFLVIEPAKREYRDLAGMLPPGKKIRVFTVGEEGENSAPFRLNPFEIRPHVSVQTHIDLLKSVFNASFGMWTPLPQVLERAIHEIYSDKGWDAVLNVNARTEKRETDEKPWPPRSQPTLTDLYHKISEMVPTLGYNADTERNVKTALETRINSLRIGAKGLMLDTSLSIPIENLLDNPTVLELEGVGDDDEKAFIMGLILMAMYEHYRGKGGSAGSGLHHITIIEEAHRLLTNVPVSVDPEATNLKGKAVETFVNMLSEVRAYGEGFIIAEQIPNKLASDVIKNTALKIMHRTVSNDDRQTMGGAMNLDDHQVRLVVALGKGEAVVHGGGEFGDDNAILVKIPKSKGNGEKTIKAEEIRSIWEEFTVADPLTEIFHSYPTCLEHCRPINPKCPEARKIAENSKVEEAFAIFVLSLVVGSFSRDENQLGNLVQEELFPVVHNAILSQIGGSCEDPLQTRCILTHALYRHLDRRGAQHGWKYEDVTKMTTHLLPALLAINTGGKVKKETVQKLLAFCRMYEKQSRLDFQPFFGCERACGKSPVCIYRYDLEPILQNKQLDSDFENAGDNWPELAVTCRLAAELVLLLPSGEKTTRTEKDAWCTRTAELCFAIQKIHSDTTRFSSQDREDIISGLLDHYKR